jgi:hypothetical protein
MQHIALRGEFIESFQGICLGQILYRPGTGNPKDFK